MVIPIGYAQVNYHLSGNNLPLEAQTTIGVDISGWGGSLQALTDELYDMFVDTILTELNTSTVLDLARVKFGPDATGPTFEHAGSNQGLETGSAASSAVSFLVRKATTFGGRAGRGRMYIPGVTEAVIGGDGAVDPAFLNVLQADLNTYHARFATNGLIPVLLHGAGSPLTTPSPIDNLTLDSTVATQRRRQRR